MARMCPDRPPDGGTSGDRHEARVWHLLRDGLPDDWLVFHDRYARPARSNSAQLDLVAVHPRHGIAVLEAKATQRVYGDGNWRFYHRGEEQWHSARSPFHQVRKAAAELMAGLVESGLRARAAGWLPVGVGVIMLDGRLARGELGPAEGGGDAYLDAAGTADVEAWLVRRIQADGQLCAGVNWYRFIIGYLWRGGDGPLPVAEAHPSPWPLAMAAALVVTVVVGCVATPAGRTLGAWLVAWLRWGALWLWSVLW